MKIMLSCATGSVIRKHKEKTHWKKFGAKQSILNNKHGRGNEINPLGVKGG